MQTIYATVTSKGQITLPAAVRRALRLTKGDRVALSIQDGEGGHVILRPVGSVTDKLYASIEPRQRPEDFQGQREAFEARTAKEVAEELS